ncbi:site-2 protease family protein [Myxococcaceae bacterium GXIMD 01537]
MFRFRLGSIPVEVHPSHLMMSAVLAYSALPSPGSRAGVEAWPYRALHDSAQPGYAWAVASFVLAWMLIVFISVLVHELGHALASRAFGYRPSIALVWMGGHTRPNAPGPLPWHRDVLVTGAGPLAGLLLGVGSGVAWYFLRGRSDVADYFMSHFAIANVAWAVLNLLPVLPLDGGRIVSALATRIFGPRGFVVAQGLAALVCLGIVLVGIRTQEPFLTVLFAYFGFHALRVVMGAFRPQQEDGAVQGPHAETLGEARRALAAGDLEEARRRALGVLEAGEEGGAEAQSQAHHLLGWVALKEGKGRAALDHFSQVHRRPVETHALAAAFSLVGDDGRAVTLWEMAWRESNDRTVMHEYAGALIRMGRTAEALRLPGVEAAGAFACAERVLFIRGAYSEAAAVGEEALRHAPSPSVAYDAACAFARARMVSDAVRLLRRASELGFRDADYAASDEDLAALHGHPAFEAWLTELRVSPAS